MDPKEKWHAHISDLSSLFAHWEHRRRQRLGISKRDREILAISLFALCIEHSESKQFLVGFPQRGLPVGKLVVADLFDRGFRDLDDWDALLIPDSGPAGPEARDIHQCQLVSYLNRAGNTADIISFLEEKKLTRSTPNNDLRLVVTLEQPTEFDWVKLSLHLQQRRPPCPFNQVFLISEHLESTEPTWRCMQLFPRAATLKTLSLSDARTLLADRPTRLAP